MTGIRPRYWIAAFIFCLGLWAAIVFFATGNVLAGLIALALSFAFAAGVTDRMDAEHRDAWDRHHR